MGRRTAVSILLAAIMIIGVAAILSIFSADSDGPKLSGHINAFELAERPLRQPALSWADSDGNSIKLADFRGKIVLLNYWSSWCLPCRRELPGIDRLQARMAGDHFTAIALNVDLGDTKAARRVAQSLNLKHLSLNLDPKNITVATLGLSVMPSSYLFDQKGRLLGAMEGEAEWDTPEAIKFIQYFIDRINSAE